MSANECDETRRKRARDFDRQQCLQQKMQKIGNMSEYELWKWAQYFVAIAESKQGTTPFVKIAKLIEYKQRTRDIANRCTGTLTYSTGLGSTPCSTRPISPAQFPYGTIILIPETLPDGSTVYKPHTIGDRS